MTDRLPVHGIVPSGTDGQVLTTVSGEAAWATPSGGGGAAPPLVACKAKTSAAINVANATNYIVPFAGTDAYDTHAMHDPAANNTRIYVPTGYSGLWHVIGSVSWASNSNGYRFNALQLNGAGLPDGDGALKVSNPSGGFGGLVVSADVLVTAGDYFEMIANQNSGGTLALNSATLSARFIGAP